MEKRQALTEKQDTMLNGLAFYWKEVLLTTLIIVIALMLTPRLQPSTSYVAAKSEEPAPQELRNQDTWPFSLHVKYLPE